MNPRIALRAFAMALTPTGTRSGSVLARVMTAVAAGTFTEKELAEASDRQWAWFAEEHHSRNQGLFPWEVRLYSPYLKPGARLLVVGAGSGRDVLCFLRAGCRVTAIDVSTTALERLRRRLDQAEREATILCQSIADFESDDQFDAVIFAWLTYIYIPDRATRIEALRRASRVLAPEGSVVISFEPGRGSLGLARISRVVAKLTGGKAPESLDHFLCSGPAHAPAVYQSRFFDLSMIRSEADEAELIITRQHAGTSAPGAGATQDPGLLSLGRQSKPTS